MGIGLKDIFKKDEEKLVKDRRKAAIRNMIIFSLIVVVLIVITLYYKATGNKDDARRKAITQDMQSIQSAISNRINLYDGTNEEEVFPGESLKDNPRTITINGYKEEYRYGYYYLSSGDLKEIVTVLNEPKEEYFVNYETGDVVNIAGFKYNKKTYHSVADAIAIFENQKIPSDSVIIINKPSDLNAIRQKPNGYYKLSNNIDMSEYSKGDGWDPISEFNGVFDGRGYTISNLVINRPSNTNVGLFGKIQGDAEIRNIKFEKPMVTGGEYTGVLGGYCSGTVYNVHIIDGKVKGNSRATGGLVGAYGVNKISYCTITGKVDGDSEVGGAIGVLYSGTVNRISFEGSCSVLQENAGGLIGQVRVSQKSADVSECVARASVDGKKNLGGFIGEIAMTSSDSINIINCYAIGSIDNGEENMGGMIGYIYSSQGTPSIRLENLYADVSVVVKGETSGGFIGNSNVSNSTTKTAIECYWKKALAPGSVLEGTGKYTPGSEFTSKDKSAVQMNMRREYVDWDFEKVWDIENTVSSPFLRWENNFKTEDKDAKK